MLSDLNVASISLVTIGMAVCFTMSSASVGDIIGASMVTVIGTVDR